MEVKPWPRWTAVAAVVCRTAFVYARSKKLENHIDVAGAMPRTDVSMTRRQTSTVTLSPKSSAAPRIVHAVSIDELSGTAVIHLVEHLQFLLNWNWKMSLPLRARQRRSASSVPRTTPHGRIQPEWLPWYVPGQQL